MDTILRMAIFLTSGICALTPAKRMGDHIIKMWDMAYEYQLHEQEERLLNEQAKSEESTWHPPERAEISETVGETESGEVPVVEVFTSENEVAEPVVDSPQPSEQSFPLFSVNGDVLDPAIQNYLYSRLCQEGIGWFYYYSLLIAYQESNFDIYAQNKNGLDKGLFQYRITYWPGNNIFDPYEQIEVFVVQMRNRAFSGCDVYTMISRHNTSDWCGYNQVYVDQVMQWEHTMIKIN